MGDIAAALDRVLGTVGYLRVTVGARPEGSDGPDGGWLPCGPLVEDADHLLAVVRSTAPGRGVDRDDVAMSLFVQGYAFRIASVAIGTWLLDDVVVDVDPAITAIALGRHRPNALHLDSLRSLSGSERQRAGGPPLRSLSESERQRAPTLPILERERAPASGVPSPILERERAPASGVER